MYVPKKTIQAEIEEKLSREIEPTTHDALIARFLGRFSKEDFHFMFSKVPRIKMGWKNTWTEDGAGIICSPNRDLILKKNLDLQFSHDWTLFARYSEGIFNFDDHNHQNELKLSKNSLIMLSDVIVGDYRNFGVALNQQDLNFQCLRRMGDNSILWDFPKYFVDNLNRVPPNANKPMKVYIIVVINKLEITRRALKNIVEEQGYSIYKQATAKFIPKDDFDPELLVIHMPINMPLQKVNKLKQNILSEIEAQEKVPLRPLFDGFIKDFGELLKKIPKKE